MIAPVPAWVEWLTAALIVIGSLLALLAALGLALLKDGMQRLHPPALANTLGVWCISGAALVYFSALESALAFYVWLIPIMLTITTPISTILIARAVLFRHRQAGDPDAPPPLQAPAKMAADMTADITTNTASDSHQPDPPTPPALSGTSPVSAAPPRP